MQINKNVKKEFKSVTKMLKFEKKKSLLQILLNCTQIQNADARLGERCEAARCNEWGFAAFLMPICVSSET